MKPIRVLQVLTIMNRGGAENMIMNYYRQMDRNKVQFDFLLHRKEHGAFDDEIKSLGGKIYIMPAISPKNYFKYKKKLSVFFNQHSEYNIIHSHLNALSSIVLSVAKAKGIPVRIAHSHLAVEPFLLKKIFKKKTDILATVKDTIQSLVKFKVPKNASHFFACSKKAGAWLFGKENEKHVHIINNAIDASVFTYNHKKSIQVKKELNVIDKKVIGHVGRFNEQKNHFFLIKIFKKILEIDESIVLALVGNGNLRKSIEKELQRMQIQNKVLFLGERNDIPDVLQAFDLFLFPSLYEGLPVTLIEAQASGLKIITSDTVTKEVDISKNVTFLSLKETEEFWAKTVLEHLNYKRKNTFQEIVNAKYDISENAKKLQEFYLKKNK